MAFDWKRKDLRRIEEDKLLLWSEANLLINNTDIPSKRIQLVVLTVQFILCKHWQRKIHIKLTKASSNLQKITSIRPSPRLFPLILNLSSLILLIGGNWRRCFVFPFVCKISRRWNPSKTKLQPTSLDRFSLSLNENTNLSNRIYRRFVETREISFIIRVLVIAFFSFLKFHQLGENPSRTPELRIRSDFLSLFLSLVDKKDLPSVKTDASWAEYIRKRKTGSATKHIHPSRRRS